LTAPEIRTGKRKKEKKVISGTGAKKRGIQLLLILRVYLEFWMFCPCHDVGDNIRIAELSHRRRSHAGRRKRKIPHAGHY
jgi:hypothetical protein